MHHRFSIVAFLLAVGLTLVGYSVASTPANDGPPIRKIATDIVQIQHGDSLAGFILIELFCESWGRLSSDSDLRPYIEFAGGIEIEAIALFIPNDPNQESPTYCVFFDGLIPSGLTAVGPDFSGPPTAQNLSDLFQTIGAIEIPDGKEQLVFEKGEITADDGTPVPAIMIRGAGIMGTGAAEYDSLFEEALALYELGPSNAPTIIALLEKVIQEDPGDLKATKLLAITCLGAGQLERALEAFNLAIRIEQDKEVINPHMHFYKAKTLHLLGRNREAQSILDSYWAFFQDDQSLKEQYEILNGEIANRP